MQPDSEKHEWKQPAEQPSQAPYAVPDTDEQPVASQPVVSMTPDEQQFEPILEPVAPDDQDGPTVSQKVEEEPVRWQAHEYIHHEKNVLWFVVFGIVVVALILFAIFVVQSITFAILVPVMAAALIVYSHRPPRVLNYTLSRQGLHINDHLYPFAEFKAFGVVRDGEEYSVMLIPTKRFQPGVSVYFPEEAGEAIVDMLGARLPMQELHLDILDKLIRKLRI
jgi:hypothetical protein